MKEGRWKVSSETTDKELCCDKCGKLVGDVWVSMPDYEVLCIKCFRGRTAS